MKCVILKLMAFICLVGFRNNCISAMYINSDSSSKSLEQEPPSKFDLKWLSPLTQPSLLYSQFHQQQHYMTKKEREGVRNNNPPSLLPHSLQKRQKVAAADTVATSFRLPPQQKNRHRQIIYAKTKKRSGYNSNYYDDLISDQAMSSNTMLRSPRGQRQYDVPQIGESFFLFMRHLKVCKFQFCSTSININITN